MEAEENDLIQELMLLNTGETLGSWAWAVTTTMSWSPSRHVVLTSETHYLLKCYGHVIFSNLPRRGISEKSKVLGRCIGALYNLLHSSRCSPNTFQEEEEEAVEGFILRHHLSSLFLLSIPLFPPSFILRRSTVLCVPLFISKYFQLGQGSSALPSSLGSSRYWIVPLCFEMKEKKVASVAFSLNQKEMMGLYMGIMFSKLGH
ncbi:unnamed protein product [Lactuca saligna]|uniref:Uncharacterized protein n=1 Tax=Lactuca saligna TaxID=75948 RepID=A0AA36EGG4_LACSI|nr:unnamed protein product [Lactuca saligna]